MDAAPAEPRIARLQSQLLWVFPVGVALTLLLRLVIIHPYTPLFYDEIVTYEIVTAGWGPLWTTLHEGYLDTLTAGYGLMYLWVQVFGPSTFGLRLMYTLCSLASVLLLWDSLQRAFGTGAASISVALLVLCGYSWLYYAGYARIYGLLFLLVVMGIRLLVATQTQPQPGPWLWITTWLVHAGLVLTHPFGGVYSATLLAAQVTLDLLWKRARPLRWTVIPLGWLAFLVIAPDLITHTVNSGGMWRSDGSLGALLLLYVRDHNILVLPYFALVGLGWLLLRPRTATDEAAASQQSLLLIAGWMSLAPVAVLLVSQTVIEVFVPRYLLPQLFASAIFGAAAVAPLLRMGLDQTLRAQVNRLALPHLAALIALIGVLASALMTPGPGPLALDPAHSDLPVVVESSQVFTELTFYHPEEGRYWFIAAPEVENRPPALLTAAVDSRNMEALARVNSAYHVTDHEAFTQSHERFLLMDADFFGYSEAFLESNPAYRISPLGWPLPYLQLMLVERIESP